MRDSIKIANVLLQNSAREILLLQRSPKLKRPYLWGLPGGMIDDGETAKCAAQRELYEETGIKEQDIVTRGMKKFLIEMPDENVEISTLEAKLKKDTVEIILDPKEHLAYRWMQYMDIFNSKRILPGVPTMIAESLEIPGGFTDFTIQVGTSVHLL